MSFSSLRIKLRPFVQDLGFYSVCIGIPISSLWINRYPVKIVQIPVIKFKTTKFWIKNPLKITNGLTLYNLNYLALHYYFEWPLMDRSQPFGNHIKFRGWELIRCEGNDLIHYSSLHNFKSSLNVSKAESTHSKFRDWGLIDEGVILDFIYMALQFPYV